ncbi:MAG TPA: nitrophenyl compound nitroreductase subunit ArsF family protein [Synergistaceae bacterium]|nr:nitrophenyl compound nitroreductase subunit ArsF family protein [Synergistaceae bacterium]HQF91104.1 nitrophenyl compound nitroreductase subunit ArsF family protein [Synergistaceae bacterium]HQH79007.1 nitrophenyl compound nitroreductase subunit ArsF family protein [Synergistaceae bacterium]HQK25456.1 nitrophenyl compound nitroreductase subunit ArsF family protein [Synergistaceae bacterium]
MDTRGRFVRTIFDAVLLVFALGWSAGAQTSEDTTLSPDAIQAAGKALLAGTSGDAPVERVLVYYLHGTARCPTCQNIEKFTYEAVTANFGAELASGAMEWHSLDVMTDEHRHFVEDFQLVAQSVVLVRMAGDRMEAWKNLEQVWPLAHQKEAFLAYVTEELRAFLEGDTPR